MKKLMYLMSFFLVLTISFPLSPVFAQKSRPQVPVTYAGDTDETIIRRAQWVEGAKKEKTLVWWSYLNPGQFNKIIAEFNKIYPFIQVTATRQIADDRAVKLEEEATKRKMRWMEELKDGGELYESI